MKSVSTSHKIIIKTEEQVMHDLNKSHSQSRPKISEPSVVATKLVPISK